VTAGSDHVSLITVVPPDATGDVDITCSSVVLMAAFKKTNGKSLVEVVVVFLGGCIPSGLKCVLFKNIFLKNYF
jgi:hypothetical protein